MTEVFASTCQVAFATIVDVIEFALEIGSLVERVVGLPLRFRDLGISCRRIGKGIQIELLVV
ncbi:MAG TPA: hypothetical protein DFS52_31710 [Myxococcales bacterium]|nr:hypothetical protein [Myxococcales bacterium]